MKLSLLHNSIFVKFAALFCCALWGISTPIVKMGYRYVDSGHVPSLLLWVGLQFIFSGILTICIYSIVSKRFVHPKKGYLKGIVLVSFLQTMLQYALLYVGLLHTTSVKGSVLKSTDVFFVAFISAFLFKMEKLTVQKLLSCVIGFIGIIIMNLNGLNLNMNFLGDGFVLLAIVSYSFSVVVTRIFAQTEDPVVLCGYQMTLGGGVLFLIGVVLKGKMDFLGMLPVFLCLSAIYAVSYTLWTVLLKHNPASGVTIFSFMTPVFGVAFSWLLLSEDGGVPFLNLMIALIMVCAGILLWGYAEKQALKKSLR